MSVISYPPNVVGISPYLTEGSTANSSIAGSGSIKAYGVKASIANANIAGSGNVRITVTDKIKAKVVGSGNIYYKGDPAKIDIKSVGSGDVIDRN